MERVIAVDLGRRRVGLAISDALGVLAVPLLTLDKERKVSDRVRRIARLGVQHGAGRFVIGLPLYLDGTEGTGATEARAFAERLALASPCPVELCDERMTTVEAHERLSEAGVRMEKRRAIIDQVAAVVLLQGWLDRRRSV